MKLLFDNRIVLSDKDVERIHHSVLFYADSVAVRAAATWLGRDVHDPLIRRLHELREIGALEVWAHEYEISDNGMVRQRGAEPIFSGTVDRVLTTAETCALTAEVDDVLHIDRNRAYQGSLAPTSLREGIGEIVQYRRSLLGMRLADSLSLDGITAVGSPSTGPVRDLNALADPHSLVRQTIDVVVDKCSFGILSTLPIEDLQSCRKHLPAFRQYLEKSVENNQFSDTSPEEIARQVMSTYNDMLLRRAGMTLRDGAAELSGETFWDVVGAFLPPVIAVKYAGKLFRMAKDRRDFRPFMLLSNMHSISNRGTVRRPT